LEKRPWRSSTSESIDPSSDHGRHFLAEGTERLPRRRHPQNHPGTLQFLKVGQEAKGLFLGPTQRVEYLPRIDHLPQPGAFFRCALDGNEE